MKGVIFCLLPLCAFQTVFMWGAADVKNLRTQAKNEMIAIYNKLEDAIWAATMALDKRGLNHFSVNNICWPREEAIKFNKAENGGFGPCDVCFDKAVKNKNAKFAKRCCRDEISEYDKEAELTLANVKKCFGKHIQKDQATRVKGVPKPKKLSRRLLKKFPHYEYLPPPAFHGGQPDELHPNLYPWEIPPGILERGVPPPDGFPPIVPHTDGAHHDGYDPYAYNPYEHFPNEYEHPEYFAREHMLQGHDDYGHDPYGHEHYGHDHYGHVHNG